MSTHVFATHSYLSSLRQDPINLLEIGVQKGASMRMWLDYFPLASVYGIDIHLDLNCLNATFQEKLEKKIGKITYVDSVNGRCRMFEGRQEDADFLHMVDSAIDADLDVIVDDGSHSRLHQQTSLINLFPKLRPGGLYFIEDLGCCDWNPRKGMSMLPFLQLLSEKNFEALSSCEYLDQDLLRELVDSTEQVVFYEPNDYWKCTICLIQKLKT